MKYGKIYAGNFGDAQKQEAAAKEYMARYAKYIYKAPKATLERLTGRDLEQAAMHAKDTAGGMDMWTPADFKFLSEKAFDELATLLNMIENGAKWPVQTKVSRAAFLSKDENDLLNPLAYRVLLMMPYIYRLWGRTLLGHLQPWVKDWATDEMFVGVEGRGAADAAYATALLLEFCKLKKIPFSGGATDSHRRRLTKLCE